MKVTIRRMRSRVLIIAGWTNVTGTPVNIVTRNAVRVAGRLLFYLAPDVKAVQTQSLEACWMICHIKPTCRVIYINTLLLMLLLLKNAIFLGTCKATRFDSYLNRTIPIRFESDGQIQNFRISRTCSRTTNHTHCSTKNFNCCAVLIQIYFILMIFMFRPM